MFSPGRIDIAEVERRTDERPRVVALNSFASPQVDAATLKRVRSFIKGPCTTLLHHGQYQFLQIETPQVPPEEKRNAVRWRIKEMVDFSVETAGVDVLDIPPALGGAGGRGPQAFAVAASHSTLAPIIQLFQDAKLPLEVIDIPELAQRNFAGLFEEENRGLALLAFDEEGGRLTFTYRGELYATRHIEIGRAELAKPGGEAPGGIFERVLLDVQRSLDNFDRNFSFITLSRLVVAPFPGAAAFAEYLKGNLYQPVALLDMAQGLDIAEVPALAEADHQSDTLLALGAALRHEAGAVA